MKTDNELIHELEHLVSGPHNFLGNLSKARKHQCMVENDVVIVRSQQYRMFLEFVGEKYGNGYLDGFKKA